MPEKSRTKTRLVAPPGTSGGLSSALPAAGYMPAFPSTRAGRGPGERGCSSQRGAAGRGQGRRQMTGNNLGASTGSTRRLSTSRCQRGRGRGTARSGLGRGMGMRVRPAAVALLGPLETAHPMQRSGLWAVVLPSGGNCVSGCLSGCPGAWVFGAWARAVAGTQREGGCQGAQARAAGRAGALVSSGSPARGGRLTPPPARPGSGGSSCRAPTAGRGPGRGPRRRPRPGRRGRRRASGNS